jgi:pterin-4a-carbinolamine dehydratase
MTLTHQGVAARVAEHTTNLLLVSSWVKLKTHSHGGITDKDFALARKIEDVVLWRPQPGGPLEGVPHKFVQGG